MLGGKKSHTVAKIETLIGQNTKVSGNVEFEGGLHIDGEVKGNILCTPESTAVLTLSENGRIEGDVQVPNIILNGEVVGDVYAFERIELASQARVTGNVYYKLIEMAIGAEVNGNLVHTKEFPDSMVEQCSDNEINAINSGESSIDNTESDTTLEKPENDSKYAQNS